MTVAPIEPIEPRKLWYNWIPKSWYANGGQQEGGVDRGADRDWDRAERSDPRNDHRVYRDRDRDRDTDLDDTRSFRGRRYDDQQPQPSAPKFQIPAGAVLTLVIYLIGQLIAGIWWAATLQTNQQHEIVDRAKEEGRLWQTVETYRLQVEALRREMARAGIKTE